MKLITLELLQRFKQNLDNLFVEKELKTGSTTEYKTLSDNNLTDELVTKINEAGSATAVTESIATAKGEAISESKSYTDTTAATAKSEAIESSNAYTDTEVAEALSEAKSYTDTEVAEALAEAKTYADTSEADAVATAKSYTDTEVADALSEAKEYADTAESDAVATAKTYTDSAKTAAVTESKSYTDTAKAAAISDSNSYTDTQVSAAKTELTSAINSKISSAYKAKGSTAFASLPALSETEEGNVYNVTDEFTTTANFVEGAGQKYPAGTNVVCIEESEGTFKWDVLPGFIDTDSFVKNADIETVTESDIDAMFAA